MSDPQQHAVYAAEDAVAAEIGPRLRRWTEVVAYLESVLSHPDYEAHFPDAPLDVALERRSRGARASLAVSGPDVILLRDGSWNAVTLLHELAHLISPGSPAHGARFVATELELVRRFCGIEAYVALRNAFLAERVDIGGN